MITPLRLSDIPTMAEASRPQWPASELKARASMLAREHVSRRAALRAALITWSVMSLQLVSWFGPGASRAFAYGSCTSEHLGADNACNPPYGNGYTGGICTGSNAISNQYCNNDGWHRRDSQSIAGETHVYKRLCGDRMVCGNPTFGYPDKNAWRWRKDGVTYRCSDGETFIYVGGNLQTRFISICRQAL